MEMKNLLLPVVLDNTDDWGLYGKKKFETTDLVFLDSEAEICDVSPDERTIDATDYAIMNGALVHDGRSQKTDYWLRSAGTSIRDVDAVNSGGIRFSQPNEYKHLCIRPALHLNLSVFTSKAGKASPFTTTTLADGSSITTLKLGEFPKSHAENEKELEELFNKEKLERTGKIYIGATSINEEFEYLGHKYVRVKCTRLNSDSHFSDGMPEPKYNTPCWALVEPIVWKVRNWDELPEEINPAGKGTAKFVDVVAKDGIISGFPFHPESTNKREYRMWQNSVIRAYLNDYNLPKEIDRGNGNKEFKNTPEKFNNFEGAGFMTESGINTEKAIKFSSTDESSKSKLVSDNVEPSSAATATAPAQPLEKKTRLERLNPDKTEVSLRRKMTDTELIKSWVDSGESVLLRGPSGIGKTERLKNLYPDLIYIKLTNNMFPEKVVGSMNLQTGQEIPPSFAKEALLQCSTEEERKLITENIQNLYEFADTIYERSKAANGKVVILLDELLNVKPAIQSLVYTLVLNKVVELGKGLKLPANTVVVATGNQKKYSSVAEDLAEPLEKRFDHILDMEPKVGEWIYEYAIPQNVHPSVVGYIFCKYLQAQRSEKIAKMGYFYEEPEVGEKHLDQHGCRGRTNDPRGWVSLSTSLKNFEQNLISGVYQGMDVEDALRKTINSKLREEWTEEFFDFYNNPTISVEDVVAKNYTQADLPTNTNEKFATMAGLLSANEEQIAATRQFVRKFCDPEYLAVYDMCWAGNDEKRMEKLAEFTQLEQDFSTEKAAPSKKGYKITVDEFWEKQEKEEIYLGIHASTQEQAKTLCKVFHKMGKEWCSGKSYLETDNWNKYKSESTYGNDGSYATKDYYLDYIGDSVYEFSEVDLEKYLDKETTETATSKYKITVDEFWEKEEKEKTKLGIHASTEEEAKTLCKVFHQMGKKWCDKSSYLRQTKWNELLSRTVYANNGTRGSTNFFEELDIPVYEFSEVDLEKYLDKETTTTETPKYKITVDEFWEKEWKGIHASTYEEAKTLCKVFHKMGKEWSSGESYLETDNWNKYNSGSTYDNKGQYGSKQYFKEHMIPVYEFSEVDLEKYLDKETSTSKPTTKRTSGSSRPIMLIDKNNEGGMEK